jgi:hypothetical protein
MRRGRPGRGVAAGAVVKTGGDGRGRVDGLRTAGGGAVAGQGGGSGGGRTVCGGGRE